LSTANQRKIEIFGCFPDSWKISKVVPVAKVPDPLEPGHFRPISILPALSKALEIVMKDQMVAYLTDVGALNPLQSHNPLLVRFYFHFSLMISLGLSSHQIIAGGRSCDILDCIHRLNVILEDIFRWSVENGLRLKNGKTQR
jgi:hypothetical protein